MKKIIYLLSIAGFFAMLNAQTGNVGINTPTPTNTLTVNGNQSVGSGYTGIAAPTNGVIIEGRTGIGTSTPFEGSLLELSSPNKGLRMPQVFLTNTRSLNPLPSAFGTPTHGMTVYNTNPNVLPGSSEYPGRGAGEYYWDGVGWVSKNAILGAQNAEAYFTVTRDTYQLMPNNTWTKIDFTAKLLEKMINDFDLSTDSFTIPQYGRGVYQINASYSTEPLPSTGQGGRIGIFVNGFLNRTLAIARSSSGAGMEAEGTTVISVLAGNVVEFKYLGIGDQTVMPTIDFYQISR